jgi:guanylate kinase
MNNSIVTITGPSGSGKSTLERYLVERGFARVISTTTRQPREGEVDGVHYRFVTPLQFQKDIASGRMVERVEFGGNYYGVSVAEMTRVYERGEPIVIVVEPEGAKQIAKFAADRDWPLLKVFVDGKLKTLVERFLARDDGASDDVVAGRIANLIHVERYWRANGQWGMIFNSFNEHNDADVVARICGWVKSQDKLATAC